MSENAKLADSFFARLIGLMFSSPGDLIIVSPRETVKHSSIHMFFMAYPIDVVWASSEGIVVDAREHVSPASILNPKTWRILKPGKAAKYVIELGEGKLQDTKVGDEIEFS